MGTMERKQPCRRWSFTPEFKAEIVERWRAGDRTVGQVARDFDLTETAVRAWVTQAETDASERSGLGGSQPGGDAGRVRAGAPRTAWWAASGARYQPASDPFLSD